MERNERDCAASREAADYGEIVEEVVVRLVEYSRPLFYFCALKRAKMNKYIINNQVLENNYV